MQTGCEIFGDSLMVATLDKLTGKAAALHLTAFPLIREDFQAMEARRFGDSGPGWAPLSPVTIAIKTRRGYPQPQTPLYATGALMFSLTGDTPHSVYEAHPDFLLIGTNVPYAQYHQWGPRKIRVFGRGSATLPQRKIVDLGPEDAARWAAIIQAALR
ncbi:MAG: phage virion morphosis protein [Frankiales bacterium]|nr:phage virion morphosis protein [Frankiales bacterium]